MLKVTLLGTGGTQPLPDRALAAAAVTVAGRSVLLDCGEGTQIALKETGCGGTASARTGFRPCC